MGAWGFLQKLTVQAFIILTKSSINHQGDKSILSLLSTHVGVVDTGLGVKFDRG